MYKALKDNKIIAVSEDNDFPCLVYDEIQEDTGLAEDYYMIGEEYILASDPKAIEIRNEKAKQARANAYAQEVDPITAHIQRLKDETPVPEGEIAELIAERDAKVEEIKQHYPYYEE